MYEQNCRARHDNIFACTTLTFSWMWPTILFSLSFVALIMNDFERTLSRQIELVNFVPLLPGYGGTPSAATP